VLVVVLDDIVVVGRFVVGLDVVVVEVVVVVAGGFFSDGTQSSRRWMMSAWLKPNWFSSVTGSPWKGLGAFVW
jgi:hypothetical protein